MIPHALDMTLKRAINETPALKEAVDNDEEYAKFLRWRKKWKACRAISAHTPAVF